MLVTCLPSTQWAKSYRGSSYIDARDIAIDTSGSNVYIAGMAGGSSVTFGSLTSLSLSGNDDVFLLKISSSGAEQWAEAYGDTSSGSSVQQVLVSLALDSSSNAYLCGYYYSGSTMTVGSLAAVTSQGSADIYVLKVRGDQAFQSSSTR